MSTGRPTAGYTPLSHIAAVPAGFETARVVYAIQSFDDSQVPDVNVGTVFVDDASLTIVSEPSTMALVGLAALGLTAARGDASRALEV